VDEMRGKSLFCLAARSRQSVRRSIVSFASSLTVGVIEKEWEEVEGKREAQIASSSLVERGEFSYCLFSGVKSVCAATGAIPEREASESQKKRRRATLFSSATTC
jgi:hypothetical protein